jgi:hypothetical protein
MSSFSSSSSAARNRFVEETNAAISRDVDKAISDDTRDRIVARRNAERVVAAAGAEHMREHDAAPRTYVSSELRPVPKTVSRGAGACGCCYYLVLMFLFVVWCCVWGVLLYHHCEIVWRQHEHLPMTLTLDEMKYQCTGVDPLVFRSNMKGDAFVLSDQAPVSLNAIRKEGLLFCSDLTSTDSYADWRVWETYKMHMKIAYMIVIGIASVLVVPLFLVWDCPRENERKEKQL